MTRRPHPPEGAAAAAVRDDGFARLKRQIAGCRLCLGSPRPLPHEPRPVLRGSATARLAVCGQAPGIRVHASGIPFSDPSGERLRAWMGVTANEFYDETRVAIVPMGFCFPGYTPAGADLPPRRECAPAWRSAVIAELPGLRLLLAIGLHAIHWHAPETAALSLTEAVRAWQEILNRPDRTPAVLPLPHPSWRNSGWLARHPWFGDNVLPELQLRVRHQLK